MKFNSKALLVGAALILGMQGAAHAVSPETIAKLTQKFEFFSQLPKELQAQIIGLLDAGSFEESMKQLSQLRLVSKQMKDVIDNEYTGKQIIDFIFKRYPETPDWQLTSIAFKQNLPSSYSWVKDQAAVNPEVKQNLTYRVQGILTSPKRMAGNPPTARPLNENELKAVKQLLALGADTHFNIGDWPLLALAAALGDFEAAQLFLDAGADINHVVPKKEGMENFGTALDLAIKNQGNTPKNKELIELLKSRGAKTAAELGK